MDLKNLNGPTADSIQSDYIAKEKQAANELLIIQQKNAKQLADLRLKLLKQLSDEATKHGQAVEDYLAQYSLVRRLETVNELAAAEEKEAKQQADKLAALQAESVSKLTSAEINLGKLRNQQITSEANARLSLATEVNQAELAMAEEVAILREAAARNEQAIKEDTLAKEMAAETEQGQIRLSAIEEAKAASLAATEELLKAGAASKAQILQDGLDNIKAETDARERDEAILRQKAADKFAGTLQKQQQARVKAEEEAAEHRFALEFQQLRSLKAANGEALFSAEEILDTRPLDVRIEEIRKKNEDVMTAYDQMIEAKRAEAQATAEAKGETFDEAAFNAEWAARKEEQQASLALEFEKKKAHQELLESERLEAQSAADAKLKKEEAARKKDRAKENAELAKTLVKVDMFKGKDFGKIGKMMNDAGTLFKTAFDRAEAVSELQAKFEAEGMTEAEAKEAAEDAVQEANKEARKEIYNAVGDLAAQLNSQGKEIAKKQTAVDTRLQGLSSDIIDTTRGSYWRTLENEISKSVGISPFVKQANITASLEEFAAKGIAFNLKERAFLNTIKDKIATTFEAADGTLLKLVRIQQADTTAARLGMESALTSFLNSMYATTEYMTEAAASIRASLYEASVLMSAEEATAFEFQVQKWMGSLYSVGFSKTEGLADTLGKLVAGDISAVTDGSFGNLLIMAANQASLPIAQILEKGLTPDETNKLMEATVSYLAQIYDETQGSNVLAQQFANVYGVAASDLKAAANLASSLNNVAKHNMGYDDMLGQLTNMANTMLMRTSAGEMFENAQENFMYTLAQTMGNNPVLSGLQSTASLLTDLVGGINLPAIHIAGFGVNLNATVADLMNVAAFSGSVLGGMGKLLASLSSGGGFSGSGMLKAFGIEEGKIDVNSRGTGAVNLTTQGGSTTSESGFIGNESGDDVKNKTVQDASEEPEKTVAEAKEEQEDKEAARTAEIVGHIVDIYDLLQDVVLGSKKFHVQLDMGNNPVSWSTGTWT